LPGHAAPETWEQQRLLWGGNMLRLRQIAMVAPDLAPVEEVVGQMLAA
jgi:hypothetical protein